MFKSLNFLCQQEMQTGIPFWRQIQQEDCIDQNISEQASFQFMTEMYTAMRKSGDSRAVCSAETSWAVPW